MKSFKSYLAVFCFTLFPAVATYLGKQNSILDIWQQNGYIGAKVNITMMKEYILFISVIFLGLYLSSTKEILRNKLDTIEAQKRALISNAKHSFLMSLENLVGSNIWSVNIRIWVEDKNIFRNLYYKWLNQKPKTFFVVKNIDGLTSTEKIFDLKFQVGYETQGLVGKCYKEKSIVYDEDIMFATENYNLDDYQKSITCDVRFCLCSPILDSNNDIVAIISFDSTQKIEVPPDKEQEVARIIMGFRQFLYETLYDSLKKARWFKWPR